jgi:hypothetical protein
VQLVEADHEQRGREIVHRPQRSYDSRCTTFQEPGGKSDRFVWQAIEFRDTRFAGGSSDQPGIREGPVDENIA